MRNTKKLLSALACLALLLSLTGAALAEVTITEERILQALDTVHIDYRYPTFATGDAALTSALDALITESFLTRYGGLVDEQEAYTAGHPEDLAARYADPEVYDEISSTYEVLTNGDLLQITQTYSFRRWNSNGTSDQVAAYCIDTATGRRLDPADFFAEDENTVYARLRVLFAEKVAAIDYYWEEAHAAFAADTPFYYDAQADALCFLFDPYVLTAGAGGIQTVMIPVAETGLTFIR